MPATEDRAQHAAQPEETTPRPELAAAAGPETPESEHPETVEFLRTTIDEEVAGAERKVREIETARTSITDMAERHRGDLTAAEQSQLDAIVAQAQSRLAELGQKAAEVKAEATSEQSAPTAEQKRPPLHPLEERMAAFEAFEDELEGIRTDVNDRAMDAEAAKRELDKRMAALDASDVHHEAKVDKIAELQGWLAEKTAHAAPSPEAAPPTPTPAPAERPASTAEEDDLWKDFAPREAATAAKPTEAAKEKSEPDVTFDTTVEQPTAEAEPPKDAESAPPGPEQAAEAAPVIAQTVRELLNIAKIRKSMSNESPVFQEQAIAQAKYAERRGIMENEEFVASIEEVVRSLAGGNERFAKSGMPELEAISSETGVPVEKLRDVVTRQAAALEDRARREVQKESQAGIGKVALKGVAYAGLGTLLERFAGVGVLVAPIRMVESWRQGRADAKKVQDRVASFRQQLAKTDRSSALPEATLGHEVMGNIAAEIALLKQEEINGETEADTNDVHTMRAEVVQFLEDTHPELSLRQRHKMALAAGALFGVDQASSELEAKVVQQKPGVFEKVMNEIDAVLGSRVLRGGETGQERALTMGVFAMAGAFAREVPGIRSILFAYTGMKAGEFAANMIVRGAGEFEALKPVTSSELSAKEVKMAVIDRARVQLLDAKFRRENPAEYQKIREILDQHEERLLAVAANATDFVLERTDAMAQSIEDKAFAEANRKVLVNGMRIAGAGLGALLGPMAAQWAAERFAQPAAAPAAEATPAPAVAAASVVEHAPAVGTPPAEAVPAPGAAGTSVAEAVPAPEAVAAPGHAAPEVAAPVSAATEVAPTPAVSEVGDIPIAEVRADAGDIPLAEVRAEPTEQNILDLAAIREGDGFTQVISRQLEAQPGKFGYAGDFTDKGALHDWAVEQSKIIAQRHGFLDASGRITEYGLKPTSADAALILRADGEFDTVGKIETLYIHKPLGLEALDAVAQSPKEAVSQLDGEIASLRGFVDATSGSTADISDVDAFRTRFLAAEKHFADLRAQMETMSAEERRSLVLGLAKHQRWLDEYRDRLSSVLDATAPSTTSPDSVAQAAAPSAEAVPSPDHGAPPTPDSAAQAAAAPPEATPPAAAPDAAEAAAPSGGDSVPQGEGAPPAVQAAAEAAPRVNSDLVTFGENQRVFFDKDASGQLRGVRIEGAITPDDNWKASLQDNYREVLVDRGTPPARLGMMQRALEANAQQLYLNEKALAQLRGMQGVGVGARFSDDIAFLENHIAKIRDGIVRQYGDVFKS